jgi:uncharacterized protein (DUF58 family)
MASTRESLLDSAFLKKIERLTIRTRGAFPGRTRGEHRSSRAGASVEFRDFRRYEPGDEFRHVDWNVYARLDRLILRQFIEEEDLAIDILIDQSASMRFGTPLTKLEVALKLAAVLAFAGINRMDRVSTATFDSKIRSRTRSLRGRAHLHSVIRYLTEIAGAEPGREAPVTNLESIARSYPRTTRRRGVVFVLSDFLDGSNYLREWQLVAQRKFEVNFIQILAAEDLEPTLAGELQLVDSETGEVRDTTPGTRVLKAYRDAAARFVASIETFCRSNRLGYALARTDTPLEELVTRNLVRSGMLG